VRQVGYLQELYRDARSAEHKIHTYITQATKLFTVIEWGEQLWPWQRG